jgi:cytoskeletal protein CcmA (bactofilin family)
LNTIIGKGSEVMGDVKVQNSLRVDGKVKGNLHCTDTVVIGKGGIVEGHIAAKNVMLAGKVIGNITAESKVFLESTAVVRGDVMSTRLVVDEGAVFDGKWRNERICFRRCKACVETAAVVIGVVIAKKFNEIIQQAQDAGF